MAKFHLTLRQRLAMWLAYLGGCLEDLMVHQGLVLRAVTYTTALKNTRMTAVLTAIDAGSGAGYMEIGTSGMGSVLATIAWDDPSGTVAAGALTFSGLPNSDTSADNTGTAAEARIKDSDGNNVITGLTVGTGGTNVVLDSVSITSGQTVTITSCVITHG